MNPASAPASASAPPTAAESSVAEDFRVWKKNAPFLYDLLIQQSLSWPSLTCQWFPDKTQLPGKEYSTQRLLLGTHTSNEESNAILIAEMRIPTPECEIDARMFGVEEHTATDDITLQQQRNSATLNGKSAAASAPEVIDTTASSSSAAQDGGYSGHNKSVKFEVVQRIPHPAEVNRARYCPHNLDIIATRSGEQHTNTLIFDRTQHSSQPTDPNEFRPQLKLAGHHAEGYGLAWSLHSAGQLLTCGSDALVCLYDINARPKSDQSMSQQRRQGETLQPLRALDTLHTESINDCIWNHHAAQRFVTCSDDKSIALCDARVNSGSGLQQRIASAHTDCVNALSYNQLEEHVFASGGADHVVRIWDERQSNKPLHILSSHTREVTSVAFSPFSAHILMSAAHDRRVHVWDLSRVGAAQSPEDAEDGPPELLFVHGGHTDCIGECAWAPTEDWAAVSVADDNVVHIWAPAENIYNDSIEDEAEPMSAEQPVGAPAAIAAPAPAPVHAAPSPAVANKPATVPAPAASVLKPSQQANAATATLPASVLAPAPVASLKRPRDSPQQTREDIVIE